MSKARNGGGRFLTVTALQSGRGTDSRPVRAGYRQPSKVHTRTVGAMNWTGATSRVSLSRNVAVVFKLIFLL